MFFPVPEPCGYPGSCDSSVGEEDGVFCFSQNVISRHYDLRHSHATFLLETSVNVKVISERLGPASVAFTLDTYGHVTPCMQAAAAEELDRLILPEILGTENVVKRLSRRCQRGWIAV